MTHRRLSWPLAYLLTLLAFCAPLGLAWLMGFISRQDLARAGWVLFLLGIGWVLALCVDRLVGDDPNSFAIPSDPHMPDPVWARSAPND
jgi:hypothetical protein